MGFFHCRWYCRLRWSAIFYYVFYSSPTSLDPQLADDPESLILIENCFEGLVRMAPDGTIVSGVAKNYSVSSDGLFYTFYLREDSFWSDGKTPVTSADFLFAFERLLSKDTYAPFASRYSAISGAEKLLSGESADGFGVYAPDDYTLVITLDYPQPDFLYLLTEAAAMPCNREFFTSERGKYGKLYNNILCNGPFYIRSYREKEYWKLRKNPFYASDTDVLPLGINIYLKTEYSELQNLTNGSTDFAFLNSSDAASVNKQLFNLEEINNCTWVIASNLSTSPFSDDNMRNALACSVNYSSLAFIFPTGFSPAYSLIPDSAKCGSLSYRELTGNSQYLGYDPDAAKNYLETAKKTVSVPDTVTVICHQNFPKNLAEKICGDIRSLFSADIIIEYPSESTFEKRLANGDFSLAILPLSLSSPSPYSILSTFSEQNFIGYSDPEYDSFLASALSSESDNDFSSCCKKAERMLIESGALIPIAYETSYFATAKQISGVYFPTFSNNIFFKYCSCDTGEK